MVRTGAGRPLAGRCHPLARLRRFAAEQQEVTWSSGAVWSKRGKTQWVEETEPSLVPCARPLAWFRRNAPTSLVTRDGHVIPFGRMQRAHLRARCVRMNPPTKEEPP